MKKHFFYTIALLLFLNVSCVSEKIETPEANASYIAEKVWVYDGDNTVLKGVIQELKNSKKREQLERRLLKNEVLWKNAEFLVIEDKKRILVPFLSIDKENIIGFFALYRDSKGKIQYDMTVRSDVFNKNIKLPFWDSNIWVGYFKAYDRTILGKKNGNPGVMRKAASKEKLDAMTSRLVCYYTSPYESCVTVGGGGGDCDGGTGEGWSDCGGGGGGSYTVCTTYYNYECFDIPDDPNPNPNPEDPGSGGGDGSGDAADTIEETINDTMLDDCPKNILNTVKNATVCDIAEVLKKLGDTNIIYNTTFKSQATPNGTPAQTIRDSKFNYTIYISTDFEDKTQLFIAANMFHELVHAYFMSLFDDYYNTNPPNSNAYNDFSYLFNYYVTLNRPSSINPVDIHHQQMATDYSDAIARALQEYQTGTPVSQGATPSQTYSDLAWGGLIGTPVFDSLFPVGSSDRQRIINRYAAEQTGHPIGEGTPQAQYQISTPCN
ncbi:hypothetical protein [Flavobacterium sp. RS13.1]|uniref:hypothetical protein n=1 Tax=Flavobacterium sp. RS13.1 TaxID=3400345 RepID=UPI003AAB1FE8